MMRVFIDASVLFSASLSPTGASREIIRLALRNQITLVVSQLVLQETERNLADKAPAALPTFEEFRNVVPFEYVRPTRRQVLQAVSYTAVKDAPIVAAAKRARVDCLVSLDRRHLVGVPEVARRSSLKIVLPENLLKKLDRDLPQ